jgi:GTP-binding protein
LGQEREVILELKVIADVALVGYPNAGKSSLVAAVSAARPEIADYPFTTLSPNLGVVEKGDTRFTVADVPGLIAGASAGKGLGHEFLRHIERCSVVTHVIDCAALETTRSPVTDIDEIENELAAYGRFIGKDLSNLPRVVALNKVDLPDGAVVAQEVAPELAGKGLAVFAISAATRQGLDGLINEWARLVAEVRAKESQIESVARPVLRPKPVDAAAFRIEKDESSFRVLGAQPERWAQQTNFTNDEAVKYLTDRLARMGVEDALVAAGARAGDEVIVGSGSAQIAFEWVPSKYADS